MSRNLEFPEVDSAVSAIRHLTEKRAEAEAQIADNLKGLASAEDMLKSVMAEPKTPENKQYLIAAKKAWRASIKAYKSSTAAFQGDIDLYKSEIDGILKLVPEARLDN